MTVAVIGHSHLGVVTACCLAFAGHEVIGYGPPETARSLRSGRAPFAEPMLDAMLPLVEWSALSVPRLRKASVVWLAEDIPLDDAGSPTPSGIRTALEKYARELRKDTVLVVSSQLPVGTVEQIERTRRELHVAAVPENLRVGRAVASFLRADRFVVGTRSPQARDALRELLAPFHRPIVWMTPEAAEMSKHALNAYLAASIALTNELARICEALGVDAREVEQAVRLDTRVGREAYVSPGLAFTGGTLARELHYLTQVTTKSVLLPAIGRSNEQHERWILEVLRRELKTFNRKTLAVWGLAYKPSSDIAGHSYALKLCGQLVMAGGKVRAYDPLIESVDYEGVECFRDPLEALEGADALVVMKSSASYSAVRPQDVSCRLRRYLVVDGGGILRDSIGRDLRARYFAVGYRRGYSG